jgi:hypothetical protein
VAEATIGIDLRKRVSQGSTTLLNGYGLDRRRLRHQKGRTVSPAASEYEVKVDRRADIV